MACSRLKVVGVRAFFFFPAFVAAFTSADEFHSVTNTRSPAALSHLASSASCVVFPDPSMPSTTNSFPGYSCGWLRLFSIRSSAGAHADGFAHERLERFDLTMRGPELELGVAGCAKFDEVFLAAVVQLHAGDRLRVAAIERFGQPENRGQTCAPPRAASAAARANGSCDFFGGDLAVIAGDERDHVDFFRLEAAQIAVLDQVVRVLVMARIADVRADVVQQRRELEPLALAIGQAVQRRASDRRSTAPAARPDARARASSCSARPARSRCAGGRPDSDRPARCACRLRWM